jgi:hypothetical protein
MTQLQPDDGLELLRKQGVVADLEGFRAMGLESGGPPDARNAGVADSHLPRHTRVLQWLA